MINRHFLYLFPVFLCFAFAGCNESKDKPAIKVEKEETASKDIVLNAEYGPKFQVEVADDGSQFTIWNTGETSIENLQVDTYPPPLTGNILLLAYSFSKKTGTLEKGRTINIARSEMQNDRGALLSDSKKKIGAIRLSGKLEGKQRGVMFKLVGDKWVQSEPDEEWAGTEGTIFGQVEEPKKEELHIVLFAGEGAPVYMVTNQEAKPIQDLTITAFPPPSSGTTLDASQSFTKNEGELKPDATIAVSYTEMFNNDGKSLSGSKIKIGVVRVTGKVNGKLKETFRDLSRHKAEEEPD